jgi:hypothetical protein
LIVLSARISAGEASLTAAPAAAPPDPVDEYRKNYPARAADLARMKFDDEKRLLAAPDGVRELSKPPATDLEVGDPPESFGGGSNKYLWVILPDSLPYVLESGELGKSLSRGAVSHTNLTGGTEAHCGGELWFRDGSSFWICGGSSRYRPRSKAELFAVVTAFRGWGYQVASFGWDHEVNGPIRFLRGEAEWA